MVTRLMNWFDDRLPLTATIERHLTKYPAPINMNIWYLAGVLLVVVLVIQLASGIWLLMNYEPTAEGAFASIQYIMRDVEYGYIIRYMHTTGASAFFALIYLHMFRGMMYGSYQKPRELLWGLRVDNLCFIMCTWLYRICLTLGSNVLLGCASYYVSFWIHSIYWRGFTYLDQRRLFNFRYNFK